MATIKEQIKGIENYFVGIDCYNDCIMVKVKYPQQITSFGSDELGIKVTVDDGITYYYGDKNNVEIEDIFSLIHSTVKVYEEAKKKAELFKLRCSELKEIFGKTNLETLKTLEFKFNNSVSSEENVKPKRKYTRKIKKEENTES